MSSPQTAGDSSLEHRKVGGTVTGMSQQLPGRG